jgi:hypothetical protein
MTFLDRYLTIQRAELYFLFFGHFVLGALVGLALS